MKSIDCFHPPLEDVDLFKNDKRKEEVIKMILKTMDELGYKQSMQTLVTESNIEVEEEPLNNVKIDVLEGKWDEALKVLQNSELTDEQKRRAIFLINEQQYIELIINRQYNDALQLLRNVCIQNHEEAERLEKLATILVCSSAEEVEQKLGIKAEVQEGRQKLLTKIIDQCQIKQICYEERMNELLRQALNYQVIKCKFHEPNTEDLGLIEDHSCSVEVYPTRPYLGFLEHFDEVSIVKFSNKGELFVTITKGLELCIWEFNVHGIIPKLKYKIDKTHDKDINCVSWSFDDKKLLTASSDRKLKIWDIEKGEAKLTLNGHQSPINSAIWIPGTENFLSGGLDRYLIIWNTEGDELARIVSAKVGQLLASSDGRKIFVIAATEPKVIVVDSFTQNELKQIREKGTIAEAALSNDDKFLLTHVYNTSSTIHLWNIEKNSIVQVFNNEVQQYMKLGCSFGGAKSQFIVCGDKDGKIKIWHRNKSEPLVVLENHSSAVNSISWHPNNQHMLISASDDRTLCIWISEQLQDKIKNGLLNERNNHIIIEEGSDIPLQNSMCEVEEERA